MRKIVLYVIFLMGILPVLAQQKGYRIEGDEVVFTFHRDDYQIARENGFGGKVDFDDLDIHNVSVAGEFNDWSTYKWRMVKVDKDSYELRKKLSDFDHQFSWEFKYVINNSLWAEPNKNYPNATRAYKNGHRLSAYNLRMFTAHPDVEGNATFWLNGYPNAKKVILAGSFNKWDEEAFHMKRINGHWELTVQLPPGEYEYRFIVDGHWMEDPDNPDKVPNEFHEYNSVIYISKDVPFYLQGFLDAREVVLSGSFNNWATEGYYMQRTNSGWADTLALIGGKHHYKFIVDGKWITDPGNSVREYDGRGNINSVCMVR